MFNVKVLNDAIVSLSDEGRAEIQKMVDMFEEFKTEVTRLEELAEGFEQLSIQLSRDKENLTKTIELQSEKITELTSPTRVIKPKEEMIDGHQL